MTKEQLDKGNEFDTKIKQQQSKVNDISAINADKNDLRELLGLICSAEKEKLADIEDEFKKL